MPWSTRDAYRSLPSNPWRSSAQGLPGWLSAPPSSAAYLESFPHPLPSSRLGKRGWIWPWDALPSRSAVHNITHTNSSVDLSFNHTPKGWCRNSVVVGGGHSLPTGSGRAREEKHGRDVHARADLSQPSSPLGHSAEGSASALLGTPRAWSWARASVQCPEKSLEVAGQAETQLCGQVTRSCHCG